MPEECLNFLGGNELKPRENCLPSREPWPHRGRIEPTLLSHDVYGKQHHQGEPLNAKSSWGRCVDLSRFLSEGCDPNLLRENWAFCDRA